MPRAKRKAVAAVPGSRLGSKRSDTRWLDPDGAVWASKFEYQVYATLKEAGINVRRTSGEDSCTYTAPVPGGVCSQCGSRKVVTERTYTPDLFVAPRSGAADGSGYYIEAKGYLRADKRRLLRAFTKARPDLDLRIVAQRDYRVGKGTFTGWVTKYLKKPVHVWNGKLPDDWN